MPYYTNQDKKTYKEFFRSQYIKIDRTENTYKKKYEFFYLYFMSRPENFMRKDYEWYDFVSNFLAGDFIQKILKNKKPIHTIFEFITKKFIWEYSKIYSVSIRKVDNPYTEKEAFNFTSINLNNTIWKNVRIKEILNIFSMLYISPNSLLQDIEKNNLYGEKLLIYLKNNYCNKPQNLCGVSKKINDKYRDCLKRIFIDNEKLKQAKDEYRLIILILVKRISAVNKKAYLEFNKLYSVINSPSYSKAINKRSQYINNKNSSDNYKQFKYDDQEKKWIYKERNEADYE